jgi:hypothetical protein
MLGLNVPLGPKLDEIVTLWAMEAHQNKIRNFMRRSYYCRHPPSVRPVSVLCSDTAFRIGCRRRPGSLIPSAQGEISNNKIPSRFMMLISPAWAVLRNSETSTTPTVFMQGTMASYRHRLRETGGSPSDRQVPALQFVTGVDPPSTGDLRRLGAPCRCQVLDPLLRGESGVERIMKWRPFQRRL